MHEMPFGLQEKRGPAYRAKPGRFYVRVTAEGVKMDVKFMRALLGEKVRTAAGTRGMNKKLRGHEAGCTALFPCPKEVFPAGMQLF